MDTRELIGYCVFKNKSIFVKRNEHGKYFVIVDDVETQKRLTSKEIVRYLLNAMNNERM